MPPIAALEQRGLPSFHEAEWEPSGILALSLEGTYLAAMAWWLRGRAHRARAAAEAFPRRFRRASATPTADREREPAGAGR